MRKIITVTATVLLAFAGLLMMPAAGNAADDRVPSDAEAQFGEAALAKIRETQENLVTVDEKAPDFSSVDHFGTIFRINHWSKDFLYGRSAEHPITTLDEWVAPFLTKNDEPLGIFRVWRPTPDAPAEIAGFGSDGKTAAGVATADPSSTLIEDPMTREWFAMSGDEITALNDTAAMEAPNPVEVGELMQVVSKRFLATLADSEGIEGAAGGGGPLEDRRTWFDQIGPEIWIGAGLCVFGVIGATVVVRRSRTANRTEVR